MQTKICSKCGEEKSVDEFPTDGHGSRCKVCKNKAQQNSAMRRKALMPKYEDTIGSDDELMAYEAWCALNCKTDEDWLKPEFSLQSFRTQVKEWVTLRRRLGRPQEVFYREFAS